ncbi:MAG: glycosyltransferase family 4 protein [bacterium]
MNNQQMKALIVTKRLIAGGGATLVTALIIEALLNLNWEVKVVCYDVDELDAFKKNLGIDLKNPNLTIEKVDTWMARRIRWSGYLDSFYLMRFVKKKKYPDYILFSTWDEMDLGRKSLQYVHWISHHPGTDNGSKPISDSLTSKLKMIYRFPISKIFNFDEKRVKENISIFNSHLTKRQFQKLYGESSGEVIHPPVLINATSMLKFIEREEGFVYSGRVVRDKNIHLMIEFIKRVNINGSDFHFHIVGPILDEEYKNELVQKYPYDWVVFEGNKNRMELSEILGKHKYAIQARYIEPFGMAAAESCKMGCLTFVPVRCGMAEFIDFETLKFADFDDLYHKFKSLQNDFELQCKISQNLNQNFSQFTPEKFQKQIQTVFLKARDRISAKGSLPKQVKEFTFVDH